MYDSEKKELPHQTGIVMTKLQGWRVFKKIGGVVWIIF